MEKKVSAMPWWSWVLWVVTLGYSFLAYSHLPAKVATHFNAAGQPDSYSSRLTGVVIVPLIMLVILILWYVIWRIDPKRKNYKNFWQTYRNIGGVVILCTAAVQLWMITRALDSAWATARISPTIVGLILLLLANFLPRVEPNWFIGIRTPWSLSSDYSWRKTHRLAGNLGIPLGILLVIFAWVLPMSVMKWAILIPVLIWAAITVLASYFYAKNPSSR